MAFARAATLPDGTIAVAGDGNRTFIYAPATDSWLELTERTTPRENFAFAADAAGRIYVIGGQLPGCRINCSHLDSVERYDPLTYSWEAMPELPWAVSGAAATFAADGTLFVFGGYTTIPDHNDRYYHLREYLSLFNPETRDWRDRTELNSEPRHDGVVAVTVGDRVHFGAGFIDGTSTDRMESNWLTTMARTPDGSYADDGGIELPYQASGLALTALPEGDLVVVGGESREGGLDFIDAAERYHAGTWTPIATPSTTRSDSGIATGADGRVYIFGGYGDYASETVEVYAPDLDQWVASD
jgi:hypothetical protein